MTNNGRRFNGWLRKYLAIILTLIVLGAGIIASAATFKSEHDALNRQVVKLEKQLDKQTVKNLEYIDNNKMAISEIHGDIKEIKAILFRIEKKVDE